MTTLRSSIGIALVALCVIAACRRTAPAGQTAGTPPAITPQQPNVSVVDSLQSGVLKRGVLEDVTRSLGPFLLKNRPFTVVLHEKHIAGVAVPDPEFQSTLTELEIKDETGAVHFHASFRYEVSDSEFAEVLSASAELIRGRDRDGLLLTYGYLPSTPQGGTSWQIFGLFDDKLVPFSKPISAEGDLLNPSADGTVMTTVAEPGMQGEVINFKLWTGNFFVIYPVRVDFLMTKARPAWQCVQPTGNHRSGCEYRVEADPVPLDSDESFVRLFAEPNEQFGAPRHLVVKRHSNVEILATHGEVRWHETQQRVELSPGDDFWLKVRIDGISGWIHTEEDFVAVGLPGAG